RHIAAAELHGQGAEVHGGEVVDHAGLQLGAFVRGGGELPLGQAVDAVVLDDVDQRDVAPDHVHELAEADGGGVAVAGDADADEHVVGQHRAGGHGRHASVHGVESVRAAEEVGRRLGRAADAGELGDL